MTRDTGRPARNAARDRLARRACRVNALGHSVTVIRTESMAGVSLALVIIGVRCEPSPAHEVHCSSPACVDARHVDGDGVGFGAALVVLGGQEELRVPT